MSHETDDDDNILSYDDYYELLGVTEDASVSEINAKSRELLGTYHPDVSNHPDADAVYEAVNQAQIVLTDEQQRKMYEAFGHDAYVAKREKYGAIELSNAVDDLEVTQITEDGELIRQGAASHDHRGAASKGTPTKDSNDGRAFDFLDEDFTRPRDAVSSVFHQTLLVRLLAGVIGVGSAVQILSQPWIQPSMTVKGVNVSGVGVVIALSTIVFAAIVSVSGIGAQRRLRAIINADGAESVSSGAGGEDSSTKSSAGGDEFSGIMDAGTEAYNSDDGKSSRLGYAWRFILVGFAVTTVGGVASGGHPWEYVRLFLASSTPQSVPLWMDYGSGELFELMFLVNVVGGVASVVVTLLGVFAAVHVFTQHMWVNVYVKQECRSVIVIDALLYTLLGVLSTSLFFGKQVVVSELSSVPDAVRVVFAVDSNVTGVSIALAVVCTYIVFYALYFSLYPVCR